MRFNNFSFKNKYVSINNQQIHFDRIGLYVIRGLNGTGKSSVIKQIVFGINNVEANTKEQEEAYYNNRKDLFSYVPQNIYCPDTSVFEYITKNDRSICKDTVIDYMHKFDLDDINLSQSIKKLSGGEIIKLCIISAIVKGTPYIIMDEPTNNLDDTSVKMLCNIIEELMLERTVVIVTHDVRIQFKNCNSLYFENEKIVEDNSFGNLNLNKLKKVNSISKAKIGFKLQLTISSLLMCILTIALICGLIIYNHNEFMTNYAELTNENTPPLSDTIMCYQASCVYDELNQVYTDSEGINVSEQNYYDMIKYSDVSKLADMNSIKTIYLYDFLHVENLIKELQKDYSNDGKIAFSSIPEIIYNNYLKTTGLQDIFALKSGSYPKDNRNEIVLSENVLEKIGYKDIDALMNSEIVFNGEKYTLVGIGIHDMAWTSYSSESDSSFYKYESSTYNEFCNAIITEKKEQEYEMITEIDNLLIISEHGHEKEVLDTLMQKYPANNYSSNTYTVKWVEQYNKTNLKRIGIINLIFGVICSVILMLLLNSTIETDIIKIKDYENYYICDKKIKNSYLFFKFVLLCIVGIVSLLLNEFLCGKYAESRWIICIPVAILTVSAIIYTYIKTKREMKK